MDAEEREQARRQALAQHAMDNGETLVRKLRETFSGEGFDNVHSLHFFLQRNKGEAETQGVMYVIDHGIDKLIAVANEGRISDGPIGQLLTLYSFFRCPGGLDLLERLIPLIRQKLHGDTDG